MEIVFDKVSKNYGPITALKSISFKVKQGEFAFVVGPSGSGKSTLIKLILNQIKPTDGQIVVGGHDYAHFKKPRDIDQLRRKIGVIFQDFQMIADLTVEENIALNLDIVNFDPHQIPTAIDSVLKKVKLSNRRFLFPSQLSGGELQRGCLARALSIGPELILADEPTGNLDSANAWNLVKLLKEINEKQGTTILMTTHHLDFVESLGKNVIKLSKES
jgi:cell division transport system ATP-binding protein